MYLANDWSGGVHHLLVLLCGAPTKRHPTDALLWSRLTPGESIAWSEHDEKVSDRDLDQLEVLNLGSRIAINFLLFLENGFTTQTQIVPRIPKSPGKRKRAARKGVAFWPYAELQLDTGRIGTRQAGKQALHWRAPYWNYYWIRDPGTSKILERRPSASVDQELHKVARLVAGHYRGS